MNKREELIERMEYFILSAMIGYHHAAETGQPLLDEAEIVRRIEALPRSARDWMRGGVASVLAKEEELGAIIILDG